MANNRPNFCQSTSATSKQETFPCTKCFTDLPKYNQWDGNSTDCCGILPAYGLPFLCSAKFLVHAQLPAGTEASSFSQTRPCPVSFGSAQICVTVYGCQTVMSVKSPAVVYSGCLTLMLEPVSCICDLSSYSHQTIFNLSPKLGSDICKCEVLSYSKAYSISVVPGTQHYEFSCHCLATSSHHYSQEHRTSSSVNAKTLLKRAAKGTSE